MLKKLFNKKNKNRNRKTGFTLIEIMVASSVFLVVMLIVSGAVVSVFAANQKSNNLRSVMDNLNLTLESMTRTIKFSRIYNCGSTSTVVPNDCPSGGTSLTVTNGSTPVTYALSGGRITRTYGLVSGNATSYITSPDMNITSLKFYVNGSQPFVSGFGVTCSTTDCYQPRVTIVVKGTVGTGNKASTFSLESTISQRFFDFQ
jgi:prepilin-type N-terminal cleavage/methylation domain-containing protein